jgi:hypothetical protein
LDSRPIFKCMQQMFCDATLFLSNTAGCAVHLTLSIWYTDNIKLLN